MEHYKHPEHLLIRRDNEFFLAGDETRFCGLCLSLISNHSSVYGCSKRCPFYLHKSCAEMAQVIQHPDHEHPLFLRLDEHTSCQGCKRCRRGSFLCYGCNDDCDDGYVLDVNCAFQIPYPSFIFRFDDHQLYLSYQPLVSKSHCFICKGILYYPIFRCLSEECEYFVHLHCAPLEFPKTIQHRSYGLHNLVLHNRYVEDETDEYYCDVCEERRHPDQPVYVCDDECPSLFIAHLGCALSLEMLRESARAYERSVETKPNIYTFYHEHHMNYISPGVFTEADCAVCKMSFYGYISAYRCSSCDGVLLHESCRKLPREIRKHPIHRQHSPLTLLTDGSTQGPSFQCRGCRKFHFRFVYQCLADDCGFNFCVGCIKKLVRGINHKDDTTHHFFLYYSPPYDASCIHCRRNLDGSNPMFSCIDKNCVYNFHFHCAPFSFPQTITSKDHDEHGDLFFKDSTHDVTCKICHRWVSNCPSYGCHGCDYTAHVFCALTSTNEGESFQGIWSLISDYYGGLKNNQFGTVIRHYGRLQSNSFELRDKWMAVSKRLGGLKLKYAELMEKECVEEEDGLDTGLIPSNDNCSSEKRIIKINTELAKLLAWKEDIKARLRMFPYNSKPMFHISDKERKEEKKSSS